VTIRPISACLAFITLATALGGCQSRPLVMPSLASAQVSSDFDTYRVRRVGIMPFVGGDMTRERSESLQTAFHAEISRSTPFEIVLLSARDLAEVEVSEPHRRGWYSPKTIIAISRRYSLDAIFFGTLTHERNYPPLVIGLQSDLVSSETGLVIWSASVHLDANDPRVAEGLQIYYGGDRGDESNSWQLGMLSPERFARFAAFQVACVL